MFSSFLLVDKYCFEIKNCHSTLMVGDEYRYALYVVVPTSKHCTNIENLILFKII